MSYAEIMEDWSQLQLELMIDLFNEEIREAMSSDMNSIVASY